MFLFWFSDSILNQESPAQKALKIKKNHYKNMFIWLVLDKFSGGKNHDWLLATQFHYADALERTH